MKLLTHTRCDSLLRDIPSAFEAGCRSLRRDTRGRGIVTVLSNSGHDILISPSHVVKIFEAPTYVILSVHASLPADNNGARNRYYVLKPFDCSAD
jgi:hypothetical protein